MSHIRDRQATATAKAKAKAMSHIRDRHMPTGIRGRRTKQHALAVAAEKPNIAISNRSSLLFLPLSQLSVFR